MVNRSVVLVWLAYCMCIFGQDLKYDAYLKSSHLNWYDIPGPSASDHFGWAVAVSGKTAVVCSPWEDDVAGQAVGGACVFEKNDTGWASVIHLEATTPEVEAYLGWSVGISRDTIILGAPGYSIGPGSARTYNRSSGVWAEDTVFVGPSTLSAFGQSVGIDGDTAIVSSLYDQTGSIGSGACYVYLRKERVWSLQARVTPAGNAPWNLGLSSAISGNSIVVSGDDSIGKCVFVFVRSGSVWTQQARLSADDGGIEDHFGDSVAISEDTVIVGAPNSKLTGAAYVFVRSGTSWSQQARLTASNAESGDQFACAVALDGDSLIVGAAGESSNATGINANAADNSAPQAGSAYLFRRTGTAWRQEAYIKASNTKSSYQFGYSVSIAGGFLAIGSTYESSGASGVDGDQTDETVKGAGAAYVIAFEQPLTVTSVQRTDHVVTLEFTFTPGTVDWRIFAAHKFPALWEDQSLTFTVAEISPGHYRAESSDVFWEDSTFFRIGK
jgi:hypothetical protein